MTAEQILAQREEQLAHFDTLTEAEAEQLEKDVQALEVAAEMLPTYSRPKRKRPTH